MASIQVVRVLNALVSFYETLVVIWCVLSWIPIREGSMLGDIATVIDRIVSPYINLFRRFIPRLGGIDFSPIVALLVLSVLENFVVRLVLGVL